MHEGLCPLFNNKVYTDKLTSEFAITLCLPECMSVLLLRRNVRGYAVVKYAQIKALLVDANFDHNALWR